MSGLKYRAFISYSHADQGWATWLHKRLENFEVDPELVGRDTSTGKIPKSLKPIFRDREALSSSQGLFDGSVAALEASSALIVLCSPASVTNRVVNEEVRLFRWRHPDRPIIPVIVEGDYPNNVPEALRFNISNDGAVTDEQRTILGVDLRENADGKELGLHKIVAGLLALSTDEIFRRTERMRLRRRRILFGVGSAVAVSLIVALPLMTLSASSSGTGLAYFGLALLFFLLVATSHYAWRNYQTNRLVAQASVLDDVPNRMLYVSLRSAGLIDKQIEAVRVRRTKSKKPLSDNIIAKHGGRFLPPGGELALKHQLDADAENAVREGRAYVEAVIGGRSRRIRIQKTTSEFIKNFDPSDLVAPSRTKIFISYRRSDAAHVAGRILDHLESKYGEGQVFLDVGSLEAGDDFRSKIRSAIGESHAVIAIVSNDWKRGIVKKGWLSRFAGRAGEDYIIFELALAFASRASVFPVLVDGSVMPAWRQLPDSISRLATLQANRVGPGIEFRSDMANLVKKIGKGIE